MIIIRKEIDTVGLALSQLCDHPVLTKRQEQDLFKRLGQGEDVKNQIAVCNIKLIIEIAEKHCFGNDDLFLDNIQEGFLGLLRAIEKFNYRRGYKFSTYATWWIRQAILRNLPKNMAEKNIRFPVHIIQEMNKIRKMSDYLTLALNRRPTKRELAEKMDIPVEKIISLSQLSVGTTSVDREIDENGTEFLDLIPYGGESPEELATIREIEEKLPTLISPFINERENEVLQQRFFDEKTLDQVGQHFNFTRERARQVQLTALKKLEKEKEQLKDLDPVGVS